MTSKEAFGKIREIMEQYYHQFVKDNIKLETIEGYPINKIEKDLEVLEMLRNIIEVYRVERKRNNLYILASKNTSLTEEEYIMIKEWLENDK